MLQETCTQGFAGSFKIDLDPTTLEEETSSQQEEGEKDKILLRHHPLSRPKKKCRFGPGRGVYKLTHDDRGTLLPHNPSCDVHGLHSSLPTRADRTMEWRNDCNKGTHSMHEGGNQNTNLTFKKKLDRPTLTNPQFTRRSPLGRYKAPCPPVPETSPYHFVHKKLGLTKQEFEDRITTDINEMLQEIDTERRQALLESLPFERVFSKEDCLWMFASKDSPPTGALWGVYCWAAGLDVSAPHDLQ